MEAMLDNASCWQAVIDRDAARDGEFFYGVITTGVYCRPSCAARPPKRANVRFYKTTADAEKDGLRPCRRCRPPSLTGSDPLTDQIKALCCYIEKNAAASLTLRDLSRVSKISPWHLQRSFKAIVGVSPRQYLDHFRMENFKALLRDERTHNVTDAIFEAGFGSLSRLYETADTRLGMTPMEYRDGGRGVQITYGTASTPLGLMMIGATDRGLCFLQFGEEPAELLNALREQYPKADVVALADPPPEPFFDWIYQLNQYLEGRQPDLRLPVHIRATSFQLMVWRYLQTIPPGSVASYQEVALAIKHPRAARAVARACATNQVALAIPCHRVIRGSGELGGYRWGLERKRVLLDNERKIASGGMANPEVGHTSQAVS
jgi:AraC family transcriptional regulator of adaptative response/methylated-DNA-[protein]-cysteine methyltransferase